MSRNCRSSWRTVLLAAGLFAAPAQAAPAVAGCYNGGATEIAAGLELQTDGRFRYGLAYGALDEQAQGRWESDGANVYLTSDPVTPPRFSLVNEGPAPGGEFRVMLDLPRGMDRQYFDVLLTLAEGEPIDRQFAADGLVLELKPRDRVVSAQLRLGIFDLESGPIALSSGNGHEVRFRFEPNDLGKVAFAHTPLRKDGGNLLLERHDRQLRFRPVKGGCGK